ncbi:MAG: ferrous iron transport protein A [Mycoplasmataceae bacterium]|jgi:Fe2+ transport system protein FeoA|nr:ferrous iron transport protein A [Mycoplasmataceae bacterium]
MVLSYRLKGKDVQVIKAHFDDQRVDHKIKNIGINPGTLIKVLDYDKNNTILHLLIYGVEYVLREKDCRQIHVREYQDTKQFQSRK